MLTIALTAMALLAIAVPSRATILMVQGKSNFESYFSTAELGQQWTMDFSGVTPVPRTAAVQELTFTGPVPALPGNSDPFKFVVSSEPSGPDHGVITTPWDKYGNALTPVQALAPLDYRDALKLAFEPVGGYQPVTAVGGNFYDVNAPRGTFAKDQWIEVKLFNGDTYTFTPTGVNEDSFVGFIDLTGTAGIESLTVIGHHHLPGLPTSGPNYTAVDNVTMGLYDPALDPNIKTTPEPASMALLALGLCAAGIFRRRRPTA